MLPNCSREAAVRKQMRENFIILIAHRANKGENETPLHEFIVSAYFLSLLWWPYKKTKQFWFAVGKQQKLMPVSNGNWGSNEILCSCSTVQFSRGASPWNTISLRIARAIKWQKLFQQQKSLKSRQYFVQRNKTEVLVPPNCQITTKELSQLSITCFTGDLAIVLSCISLLLVQECCMNFKGLEVFKVRCML